MILFNEMEIVKREFVQNVFVFYFGWKSEYPQILETTKQKTLKLKQDFGFSKMGQDEGYLNKLSSLSLSLKQLESKRN